MKTLVIGASPRSFRYSNRAIKMLRDYGHQVVAIGSQDAEVNDVPIITTKENYTDIDTVTLYLNPLRQPEYYEYIVQLNPRRVIFNPGTENPELYRLLKANNIIIEIACTLVLLTTNQY